MDGGNGKIIELLERIAKSQDETNLRIDRTNTRLEGLQHDLKQTNARLDNVVGFLGQHHADHEPRIKALEERVLKQSG